MGSEASEPLEHQGRFPASTFVEHLLTNSTSSRGREHVDTLGD